VRRKRQAKESLLHAILVLVPSESVANDAAVAQLDRASDYGLRKVVLRGFAGVGKNAFS
jgi:hypothetical protein